MSDVEVYMIANLVVEDANEYRKNGADHVSVSTLCFNPFLMGLFLYSHDNTHR